MWISGAAAANTHQLNSTLKPRLSENPDNLIQIPNSLAEAFKRNQFTIDVLVGLLHSGRLSSIPLNFLCQNQNRIITFPGISAESKALLGSCTFNSEQSNRQYLQAHFRLSLWVHCLDGDVYPEYEGWIDQRTDAIEYDGLNDVDRDPLDVAMRNWLIGQEDSGSEDGM
ncbi:hypothetical protein VNI00_004909 [Paramarasmius palmivorus]|uniref:Uncharacterized protein n=1 Tax=Paramarasmius palmivorus TaxID=297713 RepID=A0AAW0DF84_9AGAR